nr:uncharacterized protein LOC117846270 isoform X3 [Setaria viridis]
MKLLRLKGCKVPNSQYTLSQDIRRWAFKVAMFQGKWSPDIAAVLLGIIKEAELILEYMRCGNLDAVDTSNKIRRLEKKRDDMGKQPKEQKTNGGLDFLSLLEKGYLTRKTIIATDTC